MVGEDGDGDRDDEADDGQIGCEPECNEGEEGEK